MPRTPDIQNKVNSMIKIELTKKNPGQLIVRFVKTWGELPEERYLGMSDIFREPFLIFDHCDCVLTCIIFLFSLVAIGLLIANYGEVGAAVALCIGVVGCYMYKIVSETAGWKIQLDHTRLIQSEIQKELDTLQCNVHYYREKNLEVKIETEKLERTSIIKIGEKVDY
eukprot:UN32924